MRSESKTGYPMHDFVAFYRRALDHIIDLNARGTEIVEVYASTLLTHIMTPHTAGYVDLRSPVGAGLGTLVFNYDGYVYPSDEARMLTETGDPSLRLGAVCAAEIISHVGARPQVDLKALAAEKLG